MNKISKAAVAAGAAGVLLLGGAGTLAYWTDTETVTGEEFTTGEMKLEPVAGQTDCGWVLERGESTQAFATQAIVPGDKLVKTCLYTIVADGENLAATLSIDEPTLTNEFGEASDGQLTVDHAYAIVADDEHGSAKEVGDTITSDDDGRTLSVSIEIGLPWGTADTVNFSEGTQGVKGALEDVDVVLTQALNGAA